MLIDSKAESRVATPTTLGLPRWHKRGGYYAFKITYLNFTSEQELDQNYKKSFKNKNSKKHKNNRINQTILNPSKLKSNSLTIL
jgi:hypothetical protein